MVVERFPIELGHIMMFARSVGDANPIYSDEEYAATSAVGHVIAPPTFVQAGAQFDPDWPLRPTIGQPWFGSGRNATGTPPRDDGGDGGGGSGAGGGGGMARGLHAEQHFEYHRHLRPGDVLRAETRPGKTWEKEGRRAGRLLFSEMITEYRDQNDELVISARSVGVRTERAPETAASAGSEESR